MGFIAESALQQRDPATFAAISKLKIGQVTDVLPVYGGAGPRNAPLATPFIS